MPPLTVRAVQPDLAGRHPTAVSGAISAPFLGRPLQPCPISSPNPSLFLKIFRSISGLSSLGPYLSHIIHAWEWVRPRHEANTAIAQAKLDQEYLQEQNETWMRKHKLAERRARRLIATEHPKLFLKIYVLREDVGSPERKQMLALLRKYRPDAYEWWKYETGESLDEESQDQEVRGHTHTEDVAKAGPVEEGHNEGQGPENETVVEEVRDASLNYPGILKVMS